MNSFSHYYHSQLQNEGFGKYLGAAALASSLLTSPVKSAETNKPTITSVSSNFLDKAANYISKNEGYRPKVYLDSKGLKTIGIGHLLVDSDKMLFNKLFYGTIDYNSIYNGSTILNKSQIYTLFKHDLNKSLLIANKKYPKFDLFPENLKLALLDSLYRGEVHPKADQLINQGKWKEAAQEYLNDQEFKAGKQKKNGIFYRMLRNAHIISSIDQSFHV